MCKTHDLHHLPVRYGSIGAQLHFRRLDMRMLRELMPVNTDTLQISRVREARRELEEIFQREMQKESRQLDGWDEFE